MKSLLSLCIRTQMTITNITIGCKAMRKGYPNVYIVADYFMNVGGEYSVVLKEDKTSQYEIHEQLRYLYKIDI